MPAQIPQPGTSQYAPGSWSTLCAQQVQPNTIGIQATITAGQQQNVDTKIANDSLIRGIELLANGQAFGDTVTVQVVDVDGTYFPPGTVLSTPVSNFNMISDQQKQASYEAVAPFKMIGGLYVRMVYNSTGEANVQLAANLIFLTLLL